MLQLELVLSRTAAYQRSTTETPALMTAAWRVLQACGAVSTPPERFRLLARLAFGFYKAGCDIRHVRPNIASSTTCTAHHDDDNVQFPMHVQAPFALPMVQRALIELPPDAMAVQLVTHLAAGEGAVRAKVLGF